MTRKARHRRGPDRIGAAPRTVLDSLPLGICAFNRDGSLLLANRRYREMLRLPDAAIRTGMTHAALLVAECAAGHHEGRPVSALLAERAALPEGGVIPIRLAASADGARLAQATRHATGDGGFILTIEDVTAARIIEARTAAVARLVSLGEMAAGMAHELKQPLTAIALAAANAERAIGRGDLANLPVRLARIAAQAGRAGGLIDHLRRFARGWDERAPLENLPISEPIEGALLLVGGALREAMVAIEVDLPDPVPILRGHRMAIEQVLMNLVANALDALADAPEGQPRRIRIAVGAPAEDGMAAITIADTAGGIPASIMRRLFEPFATTKGPDRGTGLGLSICQGLVRSMGGSIAAENGPEGAVFTIRLGVAPGLAEGSDPPPR